MSKSSIASPNVSVLLYNKELVNTLSGIKIQFTSSIPDIHFLYYSVSVQKHDDGTLLYSESKHTRFEGQSSLTVDVPLNVYFDVAEFDVLVNAYTYTINTLEDLTVAEMCENTRSEKLTGCTVLDVDIPVVYLKAFCNLPGTNFDPVYMYWEKSTDGVSWTEFDLETSLNIDPQHPSIKCSVPVYTHDLSGSLTEDVSEYELRTAWKLDSKDVLDQIKFRPDVVSVTSTLNIDSTLYRVHMITVKDIKSDSSEAVVGAESTVDLNLGMSVFTPVFSHKSEFLLSEITNASESKSVYYGNILYGFGNSRFKNNIIPTAIGETVRPLSKLIPLDFFEKGYVTAVTPWKSGLIAFTETSAHLIIKSDGEQMSKPVNASVGVPDKDSKCCVGTLNGVIFKSNSKIYMLYPNTYSGTDTVLNTTEISKPIASYLESHTPTENILPFAIGTNEAYILMLPYENYTVCLRYYYNTRTWTSYEYPITLVSYDFISLSNIRLIGYTYVKGVKTYREFVFDANYKDIFNNVPNSLPCADCIQPVEELTEYQDTGWQNLVEQGILRPIDFELDSGQKSDSIGNNKQFVESKFNVVTLHERDAFPMTITVHVDGCPFVTTRDVNTDSAFWKQNVSHIGTLSTNFASDDSDIFNVFRQMFIRYSGKGKSIRHIIEGKSLYPFKLYEIDYRYRNLNVKQ